MFAMHGVLDYAGCFPEAAGSIDKVNGWEAGLRMDWPSFTILCSSLRPCLEQEPYQAVIHPERILSLVHL